MLMLKHETSVKPVIMNELHGRKSLAKCHNPNDTCWKRLSTVQMTCFCIFTRTGKGSGDDITSSYQTSNDMVCRLAACRGRVLQKPVTRVFVSGIAILLLGLSLAAKTPGEPFCFLFFCRDASASPAVKVL